MCVCLPQGLSDPRDSPSLIRYRFIGPVLALGPDPLWLNMWMFGLEMEAPFGMILCEVLSALPVAGLSGNKGIDTFAVLFG